MSLESVRGRSALLLLFIVLTVTQQSRATTNIVGGMASAGADFGCAPGNFPGQTGPPTSFSLNVFYDEATLTARPAGNLSAGGWATTSWNVLTGTNARITANGSSTAGFNGATCTPSVGGVGWVYGRGHADFSVTFTLDRAYHYVSSIFGNVSGIANGEGVLQPGTYTISGQTLGNSGGFSLDVSLSPEHVPPTASFIFTPQIPRIGEVTTFDGSSSSDSDGQIVSWAWDFGDGNSAAGETVTHAYTESGEYTVTLTVTDNDGLSASSWRIINIRTDEFTINVTTFIPTNFVSGPRTAFCRSDQPPSRPQQLFFKGDDRTFDPTATAYRTRQLITVITDEASDPDGLEEDSEPNLIGITRAYAPDAIDDGVIDAADDDSVQGDCHLLHQVGQGSTANMHITVSRIDSKTVTVRLFGKAANPLVFLSEELATIDWDFEITVTTAGPKPEWRLSGKHDGFPAYEIYINNHPIYLRSPGPADNTGQLLPPFDVFIEKIGELP